MPGVMAALEPKDREDGVERWEAPDLSVVEYRALTGQRLRLRCSICAQGHETTLFHLVRRGPTNLFTANPVPGLARTPDRARHR